MVFADSRRPAVIRQRPASGQQTCETRFERRDFHAVKIVILLLVIAVIICVVFLASVVLSQMWPLVLIAVVAVFGYARLMLVLKRRDAVRDAEAAAMPLSPPGRTTRCKNCLTVTWMRVCTAFSRRPNPSRRPTLTTGSS